MSTSSLHLILKAKSISLVACRFVFLSLTLGALISGCGGGGAASTSGSDPISSDPAPTPPAVNPLTSTNVTSGVYTALLNGKEVTSIVMRTSTNNAAAAQLYALYFNAPSDPDIYAGTLTGIGSTTANIGNLSYFQNVSGSLRTGTGTLTVPSAGLLKTTMSFASTSTEGVKDLSWLATPDSNLKVDTPASLSAIQGKWVGRWSYAYGAIDDFSLTISETGAVSSSSTFQSDCQINSGRVSPAIGSVNLFSVSFNVPIATLCFLKGQSLTGVAFITSSTTPGKTQRLQWLATASDGRGVSFRADR